MARTTHCGLLRASRQAACAHSETPSVYLHLRLQPHKDLNHQDEAVARTAARGTWRVDVEDDSLRTTVQGFGGWMSGRLCASPRAALLLLAKLPPTPASSWRESSGRGCAGTAAQGAWRVHVDVQDDSLRTPCASRRAASLVSEDSAHVQAHGVDSMPGVSKDKDKDGSAGDSAGRCRGRLCGRQCRGSAGGCRGLRVFGRAASARSETRRFHLDLDLPAGK
ncbi:hypothetical protein DFH09DRAFT_377116 [Mycena vulgaris]|nr:hypothetical protein DFH09DRAFT_377116 [Mycena vulgaris]